MMMLGSCPLLKLMMFSCIADWRFHEYYPCRKFHLAWGVPDESRAKQQRHFSAIYE
jgi:hypothetical protein